MRWSNVWLLNQQPFQTNFSPSLLVSCLGGERRIHLVNLFIVYNNVFDDSLWLPYFILDVDNFLVNGWIATWFHTHHTKSGLVSTTFGWFCSALNCYMFLGNSWSTEFSAPYFHLFYSWFVKENNEKENYSMRCINDKKYNNKYLNTYISLLVGFNCKCNNV